MRSFWKLGMVVLGVAAACYGSIKGPVPVTGGLVAGTPAQDDASITVFKAIPFAAPPVGSLRWREPLPVVKWNGVRKATDFGSSCVQRTPNEIKPWTYEFMTHNHVSEDCLYLNVWTPAKSAGDKLPVFVFIHGGAFNSGSAAVPLYDGEGLAKKGLVVVTINYRVGVLGYLALPELTQESEHHASGNYGFLDQIAALRWVKANIAHLGGDPSRVAVAGQSAGSIAVHQLTASPLARGLFSRAIMESGGSNVGRVGIRIGPNSLAEAEADGEKFMREVGASSLADLRRMSAEKLLAAQQGIRFAPIVDGYSLPAREETIFAERKQNDVVSLTGINLGELQGIGGGAASTLSVDQYRAEAKKQYGSSAEEFLRLYPAGSAQEVQSALRESARDSNVASLFLWAEQRDKTSRTPVYEYFWEHTLPGPDAAQYKAFHSSELPYVLNTLYASDRPFTAEDRKIADAMSSYWANFVKTGDPNAPGLAHWSAASAGAEVMELGDQFREVPVAGSPEKFAFWRTVLQGQH